MGLVVLFSLLLMDLPPFGMPSGGKATVKAWKENLCFLISPFLTVTFIPAYTVI